MTTAQGTPVGTAVLVHGLWHGAWCWDAVRERLDARGVPSVAVELPMRTLDGDAAAVRATLDALAGPVVLVGHSYGGAVITVAGAHPVVGRLVYLAGFPLAPGESISRVHPEIAPTRLVEAMRFGPGGTEVGLDPNLGLELLYNGVDPEIATAALARCRPVDRALFSGRPPVSAWDRLPSSYLVCTADRTVAPELQRVLAARTDTAREVATGHSVQVADPDAVADMIVGIAAAG